MSEENEKIDYLNDALLLTPDEKEKAARTPLLDRAMEVLARINAFIDETGAEPVSEPTRGVRERMLANELTGLRASKSDLIDLEPFDVRGLVFGSSGEIDPLDDPLLSDGIGIFDVRDGLKPVDRPDYIADRRPCPDFERFEPLFDEVRRSVEKGERKPQPFRQERVDLGEFFVLKARFVTRLTCDTNRAHGAAVLQGELEATDSAFNSNNETGLTVTAGRAVVNGCSFQNNGSHGVYSTEGASVMAISSNFNGNGGWGLLAFLQSSIRGSNGSGTGGASGYASPTTNTVGNSNSIIYW